MGSIPACAGEPGGRGESSCPYQVYPRVCGGTCYGPTTYLATRGLSPRVRGNRCDRHGANYWLGSIPACAGEPVHWGGYAPVLPVYPRVCGGTHGVLIP